jgi:hypothetical protein
MSVDTTNETETPRARMAHPAMVVQGAMPALQAVATWLLRRPSPTRRHARSRRARSRRVPRDLLWSRSHPRRHTYVQDQRDRDLTLVFGRCVPVLAIMGLPRSQPPS